MNTNMNTYVILRRGGWADTGELEVAAGRSSRVGLEEMADQVKWIRSYVVEEPDGRVGTVCIYQATDEEAVREHACRSGLPADEVIPVADTVVINEDPQAA
jgi:hypothetical protein